MKLLMIFTDRFGYQPRLKTLPSEPDQEEGLELQDALVGFIHLEESDERSLSNIVTKLAKNLKWAARKNETNRVVLHSFAHLAQSKASPDFAKTVLSDTEQRLIDAGYDAQQTPFGYFLDLELSAPGRPSARIFKSFGE